MNADFFEQLLYWIAGTIAAYILLYIVIRLKYGTSILRSKVASNNSVIDADHYYFLPGFSLTIMAKARLLVKRKNGRIDGEPVLLDLTINPQTSIGPDTDQLIVLKYTGDLFSNDEIRISVSPGSLLENVFVSTDDRIDEIIAQLAAVPEDVVKQQKGFIDRATEEDISYEIIEFSKVFETSSRETAEEGKVVRKWQLTVESTTVEIVFLLRNERHRNRSWLTNNKDYDGILTRPLVRQRWQLQVQGKKEKVTAFECMVPDQSRIICVPVRRAWFVKKLQVPKLSNGMLVENHIVKPSQAEAFLSIPIAIAKALISIPAQLLRFRIIRDKLETEQQIAEMELLKARKQRADMDIQQLNEEVALLKGKLKKGGGEVVAPPPQDKLPPLGKKPRKKDKSGKEKAIRADDSFLLSEKFDPACRWDSEVKTPWRDYQNRIGGINSCVPATAAHMITCWTANSRQNEIVFEEDDVIAVYTRESGFDPDFGMPDEGCEAGSFLLNWRSMGVVGHKIQTFRELTDRTRDNMKSVIFRYGACLVGFDLPATATNDLNNWTVSTNASGNSADPGTWGGHAVCAVGYDENNLYVVSWGNIRTVSWEFFEKYSDETYFILSDDWLVTTDGEKKSPKPSEISEAELVKEINS